MYLCTKASTLLFTKVEILNVPLLTEVCHLEFRKQKSIDKHYNPNTSVHPRISIYVNPHIHFVWIIMYMVELFGKDVPLLQFVQAKGPNNLARHEAGHRFHIDDLRPFSMQK